MARQHEIKFKVTVDEKQLGKLKSNYSSTIKHMEKESKGLIYSFKEAVRAIQGGFFSSIGGDLKRLAGKPFQFIMNSAHEAFGAVKDLDKGIREVSTLLNDDQIARSGGLEGLKKQAKDLSLTFNKDIPDATKSMYQAISSGVSETGLKEFMNVAGKLSVGGVTSMATAVDGLTNLMNAFGESYDDVERLNKVSDTLFTGMKYGKTTIDELSRSLGKGAPIAKLMGVSIEELVAASSAITTGGKTTTNSINEMKSLMTAILKPTKAAKDKMEELGISYGQTALEGKTLMEWLKDTEGKLKTAGIGWEKVFANVRAFSGALTLTGNAAEKYDKIMKEVNDTNRKAGDISNEAFKKVEESLDERLGRMKIEFTQAFMTIIEKLLPAFEALLPIFSKLAPIIETIGTALASIFESELFKNAVDFIGQIVDGLGWLIAPSKMAQKEFDVLYESIKKNKEAVEGLKKLDIKLDTSNPQKAMEDLALKMEEVRKVSPELATEIDAITMSSLNASDKVELVTKALQDFENQTNHLTSEDKKKLVVDFFTTQKKAIDNFAIALNKMGNLYGKGFAGSGLSIEQGKKFIELLQKSTISPLKGKELDDFTAMSEKLRANLTKEQQADLDALKLQLKDIEILFQKDAEKLKELIPKTEFVEIMKEINSELAFAMIGPSQENAERGIRFVKEGMLDVNALVASQRALAANMYNQEDELAKKEKEKSVLYTKQAQVLVAINELQGLGKSLSEEDLKVQQDINSASDEEKQKIIEKIEAEKGLLQVKLSALQTAKEWGAKINPEADTTEVDAEIEATKAKIEGINNLISGMKPIEVPVTITTEEGVIDGLDVEGIRDKIESFGKDVAFFASSDSTEDILNTIEAMYEIHLEKIKNMALEDKEEENELILELERQKAKSIQQEVFGNLDSIAQHSKDIETEMSYIHGIGDLDEQKKRIDNIIEREQERLDLMKQQTGELSKQYQSEIKERLKELMTLEDERQQALTIADEEEKQKALLAIQERKAVVQNEIEEYKTTISQLNEATQQQSSIVKDISEGVKNTTKSLKEQIEERYKIKELQAEIAGDEEAVTEYQIKKVKEIIANAVKLKLSEIEQLELQKELKGLYEQQDRQLEEQYNKLKEQVELEIEKVGLGGSEQEISQARINANQTLLEQATRLNISAKERLQLEKQILDEKIKQSKLRKSEEEYLSTDISREKGLFEELESFLKRNQQSFGEVVTFNSGDQDYVLSPKVKQKTIDDLKTITKEYFKDIKKELAEIDYSTVEGVKRATEIITKVVNEVDYIVKRSTGNTIQGMEDFWKFVWEDFDSFFSEVLGKAPSDIQNAIINLKDDILIINKDLKKSDEELAREGKSRYELLKKLEQKEKELWNLVTKQTERGGNLRKGIEDAFTGREIAKMMVSGLDTLGEEIYKATSTDEIYRLDNQISTLYDEMKASIEEMVRLGIINENQAKSAIAYIDAEKLRLEELSKERKEIVGLEEKYNRMQKENSIELKKMALIGLDESQITQAQIEQTEELLENRKKELELINARVTGTDEALELEGQIVDLELTLKELREKQAKKQEEDNKKKAEKLKEEQEKIQNMLLEIINLTQQFGEALVSALEDGVISGEEFKDMMFNTFTGILSAINPMLGSLAGGAISLFQSLGAILSNVFNAGYREAHKKLIDEINKTTKDEIEKQEKLNELIDERNDFLKTYLELHSSIMESALFEIDYIKETIELLKEELGIVGDTNEEVFAQYEYWKNIMDLLPTMEDDLSALNDASFNFFSNSFGLGATTSEQGMNAFIDFATKYKDILLELGLISQETYDLLSLPLKDLLRMSESELNAYLNSIGMSMTDFQAMLSGMFDEDFMQMTTQEFIDFLNANKEMLEGKFDNFDELISNMGLLNDRMEEEIRNRYKIAQLQAELADDEEGALQAQIDMINELLARADELKLSEIERLELQKELKDLYEQQNDALKEQGVLMNEAVRALIRQVIEARKLGDIQSEHENLMQAAQGLLAQGLSIEQINKLLGTNFNLGDIGGSNISTTPKFNPNDFSIKNIEQEPLFSEMIKLNTTAVTQVDLLVQQNQILMAILNQQEKGAKSSFATGKITASSFERLLKEKDRINFN